MFSVMMGRTSIIDPWLLNMGSPMTRHHEESISGSLYGKPGGHDDGSAKLACSLTIGLRFEPDDDPLEIVRDLMKSEGYSSQEDLKQNFSIPTISMLCVVTKLPKVIQITPKQNKFLFNALILGLCTSTHYDPTRPVIWTRTSLTRQLKLFTLGGFYASA
jgi:hypothetical protein